MQRTQTKRSSAARSRVYTAGLSLFFFFSGATSLVLEVAWSKELSYLLGVDVYAATTVVTAFMAGLGLGAALAAKLHRRLAASLRTYGWLQLFIGICGLLSIPVLRATRPFFAALYAQMHSGGELFLLIRFLIVFIVMLLPVIVMGMTLPVVVAAAYRQLQANFAGLAGRLYGLNTIGAVTGTLAAGFFLIPRIGLLHTCLTAGATDLVIGLLAFGLASRCESSRPGRPAPGASSLKPKVSPGHRHALQGRARLPSWPTLLYLMTGALALAYEIVWFRLLARIIGPSVHAFSIMLAIYLAGIGLGSLIGARWVRRTVDSRRPLVLLLLIIAVFPLLTLFCVNFLPLWYGRLFIHLSQAVFTYRNLLIQALIASILILPATLAFGAMFPLVTRAYNRSVRRAGRSPEPAVGRLYFANTVGGVIGCLAAGFWMLPLVGVRASIIAAAGVSAILALLLLWRASRAPWPQRSLPVALLSAALLALVWLTPALDHRILNAGVYSEMVNRDYFQENIDADNPFLGDLLFFAEGINNSVAVVANKFDDGNLTLHMTGHWVSTTEYHGRLHLKFLGHLPMLFARRNETVGVIGYGTGVTTGTVLRYPGVTRVNVFELEPGVIEADPFFHFVNDNPLEDTRSHLYMVDGRSHIAYAGYRYDVLTADPVHPFVAGASNLYTRDFYQIARDHLNPGGIFCQWIPLVAISPESYNTVLNTLHDVFDHLALFSFFGESVVLASDRPLSVAWEELAERFYEPTVYADFNELDIRTPFNLAVFLLAAEKQIDAYLQNIERLNTDNNVWLEHQMPFDLFDRSHGNLYFMLRDAFGRESFQSVAALLPGIPLDKAAEALAALSIDGDRYFRMAREAAASGDRNLAEAYYRAAFSDPNAENQYAAGIQLVKLLTASERADEALAILAALQKNRPAFAEAYVLEARVHAGAGRRRDARSALRRGLFFNPDAPRLRSLEKQL